MDGKNSAGYSADRSHICLSLYVTDILWVGLISLSDPVKDIYILGSAPCLSLSHCTIRIFGGSGHIFLTTYNIDILLTGPVFVLQYTV